MLLKLTLLIAAFLFSSLAAAEQVRLLVVDPADSETGRTCEEILSSGNVVRRSDLAHLVGAANERWDAVIWLRPEPTLFPEAARALWEKIITDKQTGLMLIGQPHDQAGRDAMFAALKDRGGPQPGPELSKHLDSHCFWIWAEKPADHQRIRLRKTIDLKEVPARVWLQMCADNKGVVSVNGQRAGESESWRRPISFDIRPLLRAGENQIVINAENEDGPAGIIVLISGRDDDGKLVLDVPSDKTWQAAEPEEDWKPAKQIGPMGGGYWQDKPLEDFRCDEYSLSSPGNPQREFGPIVVLHGIAPGKNCRTILTAGRVPVSILCDGPGGKLVLFSVEPELTGHFDQLLTGDAFRGFLVESIAALTGRELKEQTSPATAPAREQPPLADSVFPVGMQLTPLPHEGLPENKTLPESKAALHHMIDNLIDHGITVLHVPIELPEKLARDVESYAQSRGMKITLWWFEKPIEIFDRKKPPQISLYSPQYEQAVKERIERNLKQLKRYPRLHSVFVYQDEPFHQGGEKSFSYFDDEKAAFKTKYGYDMPPDLESAKKDPKVWLDVLNFRSDEWPFVWRKDFAILKQLNPNFIAAQNHDSHNTLGGGAQQEAVLNIDDVFHWGGDYADMYTFDIYPYLMLDFRYGPNRKLKLPRMSQTHYTFAQMRNLTYSFGKTLGFWVGTYNPEWYSLPPEGKAQYWMEREMAYTALAAGSDFLIGGIGVPIDQKHWDDFGQAMQVLHKAGPEILKCPKIKARAAMLFPRTQMLQTQEEYFNVGQSFEAFVRAFGELDIIHEEQVAAAKLDDYKILVMFDVKLLPANIAGKIAAFVDNGGVVIADCVPNQDELRRPMTTMEKLFGVSNAKTDRILWPIVKKKDDPEVDDPEAMRAKVMPTVALHGNALGYDVDLPLVSPRPCQFTDTEVLLKNAQNDPALMRRRSGKGAAYLLGFCLQDTSFQAWQTSDRASVATINNLLAAIAADSGVKSHVHSSNADVEVALRANDASAFLIVIAHEPQRPVCYIRLRDLPWEVDKVIDVETDQQVSIRRVTDGFELTLNMPVGTTKLLRLVRD